MTSNPAPQYSALQCPQCGGNLPSTEEAIICQYCGTRLMRTQKAQDKTKNTGEQPTLTKGMRLTTYTCMDAQGTGLEAFRMLLPAGWQFRGGVIWLPNNPFMPATLGFQIFNPSGVEAFESFPTQPFYWTTDQMILMTCPPGSYYYGCEVRPPINAQAAMQQVVLPRFRQIPGLQIITMENMPDLPNQMRALNPNQPPSQAMCDGVKARIEYQANQRQVEEDIFAVVEVNRVVTQTYFRMLELFFWDVTFTYSCRASKGQLGNLGDLFRTILTSFRLNPQWYGAVVQLSQYMIQNQMMQIRNVGQIRQIVHQTFNEISDMQMQGYQQRQQVMDNIANQFSETIRGVDGYFDPNQGTRVELPGGYSHAWANASGDYIVSNDSSYDPSQDQGGSWTQLEQKSE